MEVGEKSEPVGMRRSLLLRDQVGRATALLSSFSSSELKWRLGRQELEQPQLSLSLSRREDRDNLFPNSFLRVILIEALLITNLCFTFYIQLSLAV